MAVELKIGEFKAAYKGPMELYLRWLDKHEREPEEASPLGTSWPTSAGWKPCAGPASWSAWSASTGAASCSPVVVTQCLMTL